MRFITFFFHSYRRPLASSCFLACFVIFCRATAPPHQVALGIRSFVEGCCSEPLDEIGREVLVASKSKREGDERGKENKEFQMLQAGYNEDEGNANPKSRQKCFLLIRHKKTQRTNKTKQQPDTASSSLSAFTEGGRQRRAGPLTRNPLASASTTARGSAGQPPLHSRT